MKRSQYNRGKSMKGIDYVNCMCKMLQSSNVHAHLSTIIMYILFEHICPN